MSLGIAVLIVCLPLCLFFIWVAKNGIRAEQAEWEARMEFERRGNCQCSHCGKECSGESS